ncbi:MAG: efflux RND transporter periplasmic adaptor subunit [Planctomycetes bacterium]|nr:efflux RND transporter periplasmic adaptor subunit [Planctomycetota bacterium]
MNTILKIIVPILVVLAVVLAVAFWPPSESSDEGSTGEWTCSMHPQIRLPKAGKCPICGMDLVPVSQASKEKARIEKRAGILTEPIAYRELSKEIRTVGRVDYSERQTAYITARIAGRVDRVYADFTGVPVKKDHHLVDIYSPDLYIAQTELIRALDVYNTAKKNPGAFEPSFAETTLESARVKLRLLGILPDQIKEMEQSKTAKTHLTIYAPMGGTVIEKNVRAGQYVKEGDVLYRVASFDPIWLYLDIYEYDLGWVRFGQKVDVTVEAYPGEKFPGTVTFIDPFLDDKTRTVKARVNLANAQKKLKPAMYASASIRVKVRSDGTPEPTGLEGKYLCPMHPEVAREKEGTCEECGMRLERVPDAAPVKNHAHKPDAHVGQAFQPDGQAGKPDLHCPDANAGKVLAIRASAVLDTGRRKVTYRQTKDGAFELIELQLGPRADGKDDRDNTISYFPVKSGLKEGDRVVIQGAFLLDSQRQIEGMPSLLFPEGLSGVDLHSGAHNAGTAPKTPAKTEHKH